MYTKNDITAYGKKIVFCLLVKVGGFDKQFDTIIDSGAGHGADGNAATNWLSGLVGGMPAWHAMAEATGIELPAYMGKANGHDKSPAALTAPAPATAPTEAKDMAEEETSTN